MRLSYHPLEEHLARATQPSCHLPEAIACQEHKRTYCITYIILHFLYNLSADISRAFPFANIQEASGESIVGKPKGAHTERLSASLQIQRKHTTGINGDSRRFSGFRTDLGWCREDELSKVSSVDLRKNCRGYRTGSCYLVHEGPGHSRVFQPTACEWDNLTVGSLHNH